MTRLTIIFISLTAIVFILAAQSYAEIDPEAVIGIWLLDEDKGGVAEIRLEMVMMERS